MTFTVSATALICILTFTTGAFAAPDPGNGASPALPELERGAPLPVDSQGKLTVGDILDETTYLHGNVNPAGGGLEEVLFDNKVITVIMGTREIVDIFTRE